MSFKCCVLFHKLLFALIIPNCCILFYIMFLHVQNVLSIWVLGRIKLLFIEYKFLLKILSRKLYIDDETIHPVPLWVICIRRILRTKGNGVHPAFALNDISSAKRDLFKCDAKIVESLENATFSTFFHA